MKVDRGSIVNVSVADPQGRNPKIRPLVIVTSLAELGPNEPHLALAVTGTLPHPLPDEYVELPWTRTGKSRTGLAKRCAAVCGWVIEVREEDVTSVRGHLPSKVMLKILDKLDEPTASISRFLACENNQGGNPSCTGFSKPPIASSSSASSA